MPNFLKSLLATIVFLISISILAGCEQHSFVWSIFAGLAGSSLFFVSLGIIKTLQDLEVI